MNQIKYYTNQEQTVVSHVHVVTFLGYDDVQVVDPMFAIILGAHFNPEIIRRFLSRREGIVTEGSDVLTT